MIDERTGETVTGGKPAGARVVTDSTVKNFDLTELRESGLLYLANRAIHPYGVAISANVDEHGRVTSLAAIETLDRMGFTFPEAAENEARRRLFKWLEKRFASRA
jgi:hypothetical protein